MIKGKKQRHNQLKRVLKVAKLNAPISMQKKPYTPELAPPDTEEPDPVIISESFFFSNIVKFL